MRELLIAYIVDRYKNRGLNEVGTGGYKGWVNGQFIPLAKDELTVELERNRALEEGRISIEEYLADKTDFQLLLCFQHQCCEQYR